MWSYAQGTVSHNFPYNIQVPKALLQTKLYIPPLRPNLVPRPRLIERLNQGLQPGQKLILISAPAGFGKTTLVTEWLNQRPSQVAWLSLDEADNDLTRFLTYLIAALQKPALSQVEGPALSTAEGAMANIGERALGMLQSPQPPPNEPLLTSLINDISAVPDRIILVLDDYHLLEPSPVDVSTDVEASTVDSALTFLIENSPPQLHLIIATREDPLLPLSRLRARGQLTEIRAADLRFTASEAAEFLDQSMGLNLSTEDIGALERRTEGWIAGLQLAALSLQGKEDTTGRIKSFSGSNRLVFDYLLEEVLNQQPRNVQTFLLQTSVLDRLTAPLCDAITDQDDGQQTLEMLDRANLFIVPLDEERRWYRYHHLFADLLRQRLRRIEPEQIPMLHGRASDWYEQNGQRSDAIRQALAAEDFERAAGLSEMAWQAMDHALQSATWLGWVRELPDELVRARPVLSAQYGWALLDGGELEAADVRLQVAEEWLERPAAGMVVTDEEQYRFLPATIATARAYLTQARGDVAGSLKYAQQALEVTPEDDLFRRAQANAFLSTAYWTYGDLEAAQEAMADWIVSIQESNIVFAIASTFVLAEIMVARGRLREAMGALHWALRLAAEDDERAQRVMAHLDLDLAMLYHEIGDREQAGRHLAKCRELGKRNTLVDWPNRWRLAQARLKGSEGDLEAALLLLDEAERLHTRNILPDYRPIGALKARVYIKQGRVKRALEWAAERGVSVNDELTYLREFEHITLVRALLADYERGREERTIIEAMGLLQRLLKAAEAGKRMASVIEILMLQALAHQVRNSTPPAVASLERALTLAEPEGYFRIFVDEGPPMARLLYEALSRGVEPEYVQRLVASFPVDQPEQVDKSKPSAAESELIEPLSERELEVLQLIAKGLTNPQIAARLFLSLNTVKVHTRAIYGKLDVHNRTQAVNKARALGILS